MSFLPRTRSLFGLELVNNAVIYPFRPVDLRRGEMLASRAREQLPVNYGAYQTLERSKPTYIYLYIDRPHVSNWLIHVVLVYQIRAEHTNSISII